MKRSTFLKSLAGLPFIFSMKPKDEVKQLRMNPVVEFTPEMLSRNNYGLFIINDKAQNVMENPGYAATVSWKLCWTLERARNPPFGKEKEQVFTWARYNKVNFLTDGWICPIGTTDEDVCEYLNNNPHGQKFRLMTKEEVTFLINHRNQGFL